MDGQITSAIQGILAHDDRCVTCIQAGLVQEWVRTTRILALVEHGGEYGFLICASSKNQGLTSSDLTVEKILPIDDDFKCEIDSSGTGFKAAIDIFLKVSYKKQKLLFDLPNNAKTSSFLNDLTKASEAHSLRPAMSASFKWLNAYNASSDTTSLSSFTRSLFEVPDNPRNQGVSNMALVGGENQTKIENFLNPNSDQICLDLESPDGFSNLPRQSIASGATPLAPRESAIRLQMAMREDEYTDVHNFKVFVGTWNVNGQSPTISLVDWLSCMPEAPDVYVVGFQELDLSKEAFVFTDSPREGEWRHAVSNGLHSGAKYVIVKLVRLIGMMLIVYVQVKHAPYVHDISCETVGTGIMGKVGNKGGVAVRLDLHNTTMCFVNCHLAAHMDEWERRNQDYNDICSRMSFSQFKPPKFIKDHDHIFFFGDFNYRIMDLDIECVKNLIDKAGYSMLLEHDQLKIQQRLKKVLVGFQEGPINFQPTYKYDIGTNNWHLGEKQRVPAWCDRILWKGEPIRQLHYWCHMSLMISDHKPVSALFDSGVKVVDVAKERKVYEDVMKKLDKLENEFLPQVTIDKTEIMFNNVTFLELQTCYLTIANTGQVPVIYEFIKKLNDTEYCKEWLTIKPYTQWIMPGEKCDVELEVYVDKQSGNHLNAGRDRIYDILVLHLHGGKDLFISFYIINGVVRAFGLLLFRTTGGLY